MSGRHVLLGGLSFCFALSCAHRADVPEAPGIPEPPVTPAASESGSPAEYPNPIEPPGRGNSDALLASLEEILATEGSQLDPATRQPWPPAEWTHGRAYTYNFVRYGPGHQLRVFDEKGWSDGILQTLELTHEQAEVAVELTHRTQGDVRASKCAFPRHAVVLFDHEDQPVASMNICFECTDILVWPPYFEDETLGDSRYALDTSMDEDGVPIEMPLIFAVHEGVLSSWERFFDLAGAEQFTR